MSQATQPRPGAAPAKPKARKDWEPFWRIIAGLMLVVIAWVVWVLYQITPRSVATPMAYESRARPTGAASAPAGASAAPAPLPPVATTLPAESGASAPPASQRSAADVAADVALDQAQAAAHAGAHQASADVQAAALEKAKEAKRGGEPQQEGLKLSTEIGTPPVENKGLPEKQ
jgi:hypothetical protein